MLNKLTVDLLWWDLCCYWAWNYSQVKIYLPGWDYGKGPLTRRFPSRTIDNKINTEFPNKAKRATSRGKLSRLGCALRAESEITSISIGKNDRIFSAGWW